MGVFKQKTTKGETKFYHYRFMMGGEWHRGVCEHCCKKPEAIKFESKVKDTLKKLKAQKTVTALVENFREELTGGTKITIKDAFDKALNKPRQRKASEKQKESKRSYWRDFVAFLKAKYPAAVNLSDVTKPMAEEYINHLRTIGRFDKEVSQEGKKAYERKHNLSPKSANIMHTALNEVFNLLFEDAGLLLNPFAAIKKTAHDMQEREAFTEEELKLIFQKASDDNPFIYALFAIGVSTGLREADICLLKWGEVNLEQGYLSRVTRKTGKLVEIPIIPPLRNFLLIQKKKTGGGEYVLPDHAALYTQSPDGISWRVKGFLESLVVDTKKKADGTKEEIKMKTTKLVEGRTRAVSIKDVHSCRHTFAYLAGLYGVPLPIVKDILGHMSPEMTARYQAHADRTAKAQMMARMPSFLLEGKAPLIPGAESTTIDAEALPVKTDADRVKDALAYLKGREKLTKVEISNLIKILER